MIKIVCTYGGAGGALLAATLFATVPLSEDIGFEYGAIIGYTSMIVAFLLVYFGVRSYRDTVAGGVVSFGRALQVALAITAVITVCYVAAWEVIYFTSAQDFMAQYAAHAIEQARIDGATEDELAKMSKEMADFAVMYENPLVNIAVTALEPLPVGLVFALISAGTASVRSGSRPATA